jgi:hypothetical protein
LGDRDRYFAAILGEIITSKGNVERSKAEVLKARGDSASYSLLSMSRPFQQQVRQLSDGSFRDAKCPGALPLPHRQPAISWQRPCPLALCGNMRHETLRPETLRCKGLLTLRCEMQRT